MTRGLVWTGALLVLLGAAILAGQSRNSPATGRSAAVVRDPDLARCQAMGEASGADARCRAAWASARKRFFGGVAS